MANNKQTAQVNRAIPCGANRVSKVDLQNETAIITFANGRELQVRVSTAIGEVVVIMGVNTDTLRPVSSTTLAVELVKS